MASMRRNFIMLMLTVAAILLCSHQQQVVAREVAENVAENGNWLGFGPWDWPCYLPWPYPWPRPWPCPPPPRPKPKPCPPPKPKPCPPPKPKPCPPKPKPSPPPPKPKPCPPKPKPSPPPPKPKPCPPKPKPSPPPPKPKPSPPPPAPSSACSPSDQSKVKTCMFNTTSIDACCPTYRNILGTSCPCYKYAEDLDNQMLITLEAYCDVTSPCRPTPPPQPKPTSPCSPSDQSKVKTCMFNTTSIDACCPTYQSILGTSCSCYKYAEDLDNQMLITLEAYCDVTTPCKGVQVIKLLKEE